MTHPVTTTHLNAFKQLEKIKCTHLKTSQSESHRKSLSNQNSSGYSSDSSRYSTTSSTQKNRRRGGRRGRARKNSTMSDYQSDIGESVFGESNLTSTETESEIMEVINSSNQTDDFKSSNQSSDKVEEWLHSNSSQVNVIFGQKYRKRPENDPKMTRKMTENDRK